MSTNTVLLENPQAPQALSLFDRKPWLALLLAICVSAMCLWMTSIMLNMAYYMHQITAYVESMSNDVGHMSLDMGVMENQFEKMNSHVASMEFTMKELNSHMIDMEATVLDVDRHMNQMQSNLKDIQAGMQKDMDGMRIDVVDLESSIRFITANVGGITAKMERMVYDINRTSRSFSSPSDYMQNMMSPP